MMVGGKPYHPAWDRSAVFYVADYDILVLVTLASALLLFTFIVGMTGTILNSRPILAMYALLLWPAFIALLAVGAALLVCAAVYELYTTKSPIIPPRLMKTRTSAAVFVSIFIHAFAFFTGAFAFAVWG